MSKKVAEATDLVAWLAQRCEAGDRTWAESDRERLVELRVELPPLIEEAHRGHELVLQARDHEVAQRILEENAVLNSALVAAERMRVRMQVDRMQPEECGVLLPDLSGALSAAQKARGVRRRPGSVATLDEAPACAAWILHRLHERAGWDLAGWINGLRELQRHLAGLHADVERRLGREESKACRGFSADPRNGRNVVEITDEPTKTKNKRPAYVVFVNGRKDQLPRAQAKALQEWSKGYKGERNAMSRLRRKWLASRGLKLDEDLLQVKF